MDSEHSGGHHGKWPTFFAMIATSIVTMFVLKYSALWEADHAFFSQTRMWMALMMGMAMIIIMLGFVLFLFLVRSQQTVEDEAWMKAMIPHHSIAILTSERAEISDPRVRALADKIIEAQVKEIAEMKLLLADIEANGELGDGTALPPRTAALTPRLEAEAKASLGRPVTAEIEEELDPGD